MDLIVHQINQIRATAGTADCAAVVIPPQAGGVNAATTSNITTMNTTTNTIATPEKLVEGKLPPCTPSVVGSIVPGLSTPMGVVGGLGRHAEHSLSRDDDDDGLSNRTVCATPMHQPTNTYYTPHHSHPAIHASICDPDEMSFVTTRQRGYSNSISMQRPSVSYYRGGGGGGGGWDDTMNMSMVSQADLTACNASAYEVQKAKLQAAKCCQLCIRSYNFMRKQVTCPCCKSSDVCSACVSQKAEFTGSNGSVGWLRACARVCWFVSVCLSLPRLFHTHPLTRQHFHSEKKCV